MKRIVMSEQTIMGMFSVFAKAVTVSIGRDKTGLPKGMSFGRAESNHPLITAFSLFVAENSLDWREKLTEENNNEI